MVQFLTKRPIAVSMTFIAFIMLGLASMNRLPVSLMPDIDIPEITVHIDGENYSARQLENAIVRPIRRQLLQVPHLDNIESETRNEHAVIRLRFEYGTRVDMAFIDVNEKIDRSMNYLPRDFTRPRVIKASASDIPVFYLHITAGKNYMASNHQDAQQFVDLSRFTSHVIKKRLEQLPEVAMADISGTRSAEVAILPNRQRLNSLGFTLQDVEQAVLRQNYELGDIVVKDGQYQYNLKFEREISDINNLKNILFESGGKTFRLEQLARVITRPSRREGIVSHNGTEAVAIAVIKNSGARMQDLKESLHSMVDHFRNDYPSIHFDIVRDQTQLLDYTIHNLGQTLWIGALLAFLIMIVFLRDVRSPLLIGISIPTSLILSVLFFYLFKISINIISLSGLVLGIGMMIDNSIIVIDNISQHLERGKNLLQACVDGTNEIIRPLLSSVLTTCAVFLPLIFISGMAGALFFDQAVAVTIGLFSSFIVSITLIPVYFKLFYQRAGNSKKANISALPKGNYSRIYEKGLHYVFRKQFLVISLAIIVMAAGIFTFNKLSKSRLPEIRQDDFFMYIDWDEKINVEENERRAELLTEACDSLIRVYGIYAGNQDFLMQQNAMRSAREADIYIQTYDRHQLHLLQNQLGKWISDNYPDAGYRFSPPENIFEKLFSNNQAVLEAHIIPMEKGEGLELKKTRSFIRSIQLKQLQDEEWQIPVEEHLEISPDNQKLILYKIERQEMMKMLQSLFNQYQITEIKSSQEYFPVILGQPSEGFLQLLDRATVKNREGIDIPLRELIELNRAEDFKKMHAGKAGEYFPLPINISKDEVEKVMQSLENQVAMYPAFDIHWSGSYFANRQMLKEITIILLISLLLLYFILAAQFESLSLPFIVLLEVPIDIGGALLFLALFGQGINIMSLIGMIVMTGIIINDSILKIDTINRLRLEGYSLIRAIILGGKRRLKPILMTSLTTIMAMVPFLFISGMGSDLQKPLAVAVIGGMFIGTIISLYFIPLFYYFLKREKR